jgi:hypothetical protein
MVIMETLIASGRFTERYQLLPYISSGIIYLGYNKYRRKQDRGMVRTWVEASRSPINMGMAYSTTANRVEGMENCARISCTIWTHRECVG